MQQPNQNHEMMKSIPYELRIADTDEMLDLMATCWYEGYTGLIIQQESLPVGFFDLKSGVAGEILQKFSNYRMRIVIEGDFSQIRSKSLSAFITECNRGGDVCFSSLVPGPKINT
jgi:hypothetical protein